MIICSLFNQYLCLSAGPAVNISIPDAPGDAAVGGTRRSPITVVWQVEPGRTARGVAGFSPIQIRQLQTSGSVYQKAGWQLPDATQERPISAFRLAQPQ